MKSYCPHCGKPYQIKGNFCSSCGESLNSFAKKEVKQAPASTFTPFVAEREDDEDSNYLDRISHLDIRINKLELDIPVYKPVRETVGGVMSQKGGGENYNRGVGPYLGNPERALQELAKEGGSAAKNISID